MNNCSEMRRLKKIRGQGLIKSSITLKRAFHKILIERFLLDQDFSSLETAWVQKF